MVIGVSPYSVPAPPLIDVTVLPDNEAVSNVWPTCKENMYGLFITTNKLHYVGNIYIYGLLHTTKKTASNVWSICVVVYMVNLLQTKTVSIVLPNYTAENMVYLKQDNNHSLLS